MFFWTGHSEQDHRQAGVGFGVGSSIVMKLESHPMGINPRLKTLRLTLANNHFATLVSAYAPTLTAPKETKELFYEGLNNVIRLILRNDKLILNGRLKRPSQTRP